MTQIVLDIDEYNLALPESVKNYHAQKVPLSVDVDMISGRRVRELVGMVWSATYQYGYLSDYVKDTLISVCEKGQMQPIRCGILLPKSSDGLYTNDFIVTSFTYPKFFWSRNSKGNIIPVWGDFNLELREVKPND